MKKGDIVTLANEDHCIFVKVVKVGRKYLHGRVLFKDLDEIKESWDVRKVDMTGRTIYPGMRMDIREIQDEHQRSERSWCQDKDKARREIEWKLRDVADQRMKEWKAKNPKPTKTKLPVQGLQGKVNEK